MFACVFVPDFPLQAVLRAKPHLRNRAVVVLNNQAPLYTVAAANLKARQVGIQIGMTKLQAEVCPGIEIHWRSQEEELAAHQTMLECAQSFSPRIESGERDTLVVDISGLGHLFGQPAEIAQRLSHAARNLGLEVNVAVAANPQAATLAARGIAGVVVIPPGQETKYLSKLPIEVLQLAPEMAETLERWGIRTSGELAALPEVELSERLGHVGLRAQSLSRGASSHPLAPQEEPLKFEETRELEYALETLEPLSFVLSAMLADLTKQLAQYSLAAAEIHLSLQLDSRAVPVYEREFKLSVPTRDGKVLLKLLQLNLEAVPPEAAIVKVMLRLEPARPRITQHGFFITSGPEPQKLELALTRIANLLGEDRVGSAELLDTHRPDSFRMVKFQECAQEKALRKPKAAARVEENGHAVMRRFRPPLRARVWLRDGRPISLSFSDMHGKVIAASGPWRTSGDWWRESRWERDEWEVAANLVLKRAGTDDSPVPPEAALYRISYDLSNSRWLVEASYD